MDHDPDRIAGPRRQSLTRPQFQQGQKALFVVSALIGLALTSAIVASGSLLGFDPRLAKLAAVAVSFTVTWLLRDSIVFRKDALA